MNDAGTPSCHMLDVRELTAEAFAPYGQVIAPLRTGGQGAETSYDPEASAGEAKLVLGNGEPRLWIMHLPHVGLGFTRIARHRRVTSTGAIFKPCRSRSSAATGSEPRDAEKRITTLPAR